MAAPKTVKTYDLNGTLKDFPITFEYLARKFITVTLIGTDRRELILNTDFRFSTPTQITTLRAAAWGPADNYELIEIRRLTSATDRLVDFADGSILRAFDLNTSQIQSLHIAEEARDLTADTIGVNDEGNLDARAKRIVNVADPVDPGDAVTLRYEQDHAASTLGNKVASEAARDIALGARDTTLTYRDAAGVHAGNANTSAGTATTQAGLSTTAKVASEAARDAALGYRDTASTHASTATTQAGVATTQAGLSDTAKTASEAARDTAQTYATQVQYGTVPLFSVQWWSGKRSAIPAGHIPADGQTISRSLYTDVTSNVVAMMGTITDASWVATPTLRGNWADGDGSTTWRVPDLNGKSSGTIGAPFLRGDGTLSAAIAGTIQGDAIRNIVAGWSEFYGGIAPGSGTGAIQTGETVNGNVGNNVTINKGGSANFDASRVVPTASENRPLNVTGCFIIKVFGAVNNTGGVDFNQVVTELGLQNSRVSVLENAGKEVYASLRIASTHSNPGSTGTENVRWDSDVSTGGITISGTGQITVPIAGKYRISFSGIASSSAGSTAFCRLYLNKAPASGAAVKQLQAGGNINTMPSMNMILPCVAGDLITVQVDRSSDIGFLYNNSADRWGSFVIERIDN